MKRWIAGISALGLLSLVGCSGMRETKGAFVAHGESFRFFGYAIPHDDQEAAMSQVPKGGNITNVSSTAADWTSFAGVLGNIMGLHFTQVGGTTK